MTESERLVQRLVVTFPSVDPVYREHLADMHGELLPYLLMADVARWAHTSAPELTPVVSSLVDWLEHEFAVASPPEQDLIALGFVEAIPFTPEGDPLLQLLGPEMRKVAKELGLLTPPAPKLDSMG